MAVVVIDTPEDFSFAECMVFLNRSQQELAHSVDNSLVRKLIRFGRKLCLLEVSATPDGLEVHIPNLNGQAPELERHVEDYTSEWFDLKRDLSGFYALADTDHLLRNVVKKHHGLRLVRVPNLFQALCWAILGQQINLTFAYTLYRRFIENFGESHMIRKKSYWLFPEPERVAGLQVAELTKLQMTNKKSEYLIGVARLISKGQLSRDTLVDIGPEKAHEKLVSIRGVGSWTANYVMMRCLGYPSAFPIEDVGLHKAIQIQLGMEKRPTIEEVRNLSKHWQNWQAYATFYLYRSLL